MTTYAEFIAAQKLKDQEKAAASAGIVVGATETSPDQVAGDMRLAQDYAKETGKPQPPLPMVAENRSLFQQEVDKTKTGKTLAQSPTLAEWLRKPENAAIAKDSVEELSWFEGIMGTLGKSVASGPQAVAEAGKAVAYPAGRAVERGAITTTAIPPVMEGIFNAEMARDVGKTQDQIFQEIVGTLGPNAGSETMLADARRKAQLRFDTVNSLSAEQQAGLVEMSRSAFEEARSIIDSVRAIPMSDAATRFRDEGLAGAENSVGGFFSAIGSDPGGAVAFLLETAAESIPLLGASTAATLVGGPGAGAGVMGGGSMLIENATEVDTFLREKGLDLTSTETAAKVLMDPEIMREAKSRGLTRGLIVGLLDAISGGVAGQTLAKSPVGNMLLQGLTQVAFGSGGEALAQAANGDELKWADILIEGLAEFATAPVEVIGVGGQMFQDRAAKAEAARQYQARLSEFVAAAAAAKVRELAPDAFRDYIARTTAGKPSETMYVPADVFDEYFQSTGLDPDEVIAQLDGVNPNQVAEARATGGDIAIPTATFAAKIAGTKHDKVLLQNSRFDPEDMTFAEAETWEAEKATMLEQAMQQAETIKATAAVEIEAGQAIFDTMVQRITAAGWDATKAKNEALLYRKFFETRAARSGQSVASLLERYPLPEMRGAAQQGADVAPAAVAAAANFKPSISAKAPDFDAEIRKAGKNADGESYLYLANPELNYLLTAAAGPLGYDKETSIGFVQRAITAGRPDIAQEFVNRMYRSADRAKTAKPGVDEDNPRYASIEEGLSRRAVQEQDDADAVLAAYREAVSANAETPADDGLYDQTGQAKTDSEAFKRYFDGSKVVAEDGSPLVVYHGTDAADFAGFKPGSWFSASKSEASAYSNTYELKRREKATGKYAAVSMAELDGARLPYAGSTSDFDSPSVGDVYATDGGVRRYLGEGRWEIATDVVVQYGTTEYDDDGEMTTTVVAGDASSQAQGEIDEYEAAVQSNWPGGDSGRVIPAYLSIKNPIKLGAMEANRIASRMGMADPEIEAKIAEYEAQGYDGIETESDEATMNSEVAKAEGGIPKQYIAFRPEQVKSVFNRGTFDTANPDILAQAGVPLFDNPLPIEGKVTVRAIGEAMTQHHLDEHGRQYFPETSEEDYRAVLGWMGEEIATQLKHPNSGVGWYGKDVQLSMELASKVYPTLATNPTHRDLFLTFAGLFSNGAEPEGAFMNSAEAFEFFLATGDIPVNRAAAAVARGQEAKQTTFKNPRTGETVNQAAGWGVRNQANEQQLQFVKTLAQREGSVEAAINWLRTPQPRTEINRAMTETGLYKAGRYTTKAEIAGPDAYGIMAFGQKLGRYTMGLHGVEIDAGDTTIDLWYSRTYRRLTGRLLETPLGPEGVVGGPTEQDRKVIFRLTGDLVQQFDLPAGDVQAVLWFWEKRLWGAQGLRTNEGTNSSGARKLLRSKGIDDGTGSDGAGDVSGVQAEGAEYAQSGYGDRAGRYSGGGLTPLPGAPVVAGASGPDQSLVAVAEEYARANGIDLRRQATFVDVDPARAFRIASAYEAMPHAPNDPMVRDAYASLIEQTTAQYRALEAAGYKFWFMDPEADPYNGNPWSAMRDLRANKSMAVFPTEAGFGSGAQVNIGLANPKGGADLKPDEVLAALKEVGAEVEGSSLFTSDSEPTLVIKINGVLSKEQGDRLSEMLGQEAIAQRTDDEKGQLFGPMAEAWGPYNADLFVTSTGARASEIANPLLAETGIEWGLGSPDGPKRPVTANDLFRAVHDAFGHGLEGAGFRARGEENAWQAHVRLFQGSAVAAITSETRGQNSWLNYGPHGEANRTASVFDTVFAEQKTGIMPDWTWLEGRALDEAPVTDERGMRYIEPRPQLPIRADGKVELTHWSNSRRKVIDPAKAGSGPLVGPDYRSGAEMSFYGIDAASSRAALQNPNGYVKESGLGPYRHVMAVDPARLYPWFEDPMGLKDKFQREEGMRASISDYQEMIREAGYLGYYTTEDGSGSAVHGLAAAVFEPLKAERIIDERTAADMPIRKPAVKRPSTLKDFVVNRGGIWKGDDRGDIAALEYRRPGFLKAKKLERSTAGNNGGGLTLDDMREAAVEAGYLPDGSDINALIDALGEDVRGNRVIAQADMNAEADWTAFENRGQTPGEMDAPAPAEAVDRSLFEDPEGNSYFQSGPDDGVPENTIMGPDGEPVRLYHGTNKAFDKFTDGRIFLTNQKGLATQHALRAGTQGARTIEVNAALENPLEIAIPSGVEPDGYWLQNTMEIESDMAKGGYDGLMIYNPEGDLMVIATRGSQVMPAVTYGKTFNQNLMTPVTQDFTETDAFKEWFGNSQVVDDEGKPKVVFHGSENAGFVVFDTEGNGKTRGTGAFFTDEVRNAQTYSGTRKDVEFPNKVKVMDRPTDFGFGINTIDGVVWLTDPDGYEVEVKDGETTEQVMETLVDDWLTSDRYNDPARGNYSVYLSLQNPMIHDAGGASWDALGQEEVYQVKDENGDMVEYFYSYEEAESFVGENPDEGYEVVTEPLPGNQTTDEIVREAREYGDYDGVIFQNILDEGPHSHGYGIESTVYVVFKPNQIKSVRNRGTFSRKSNSILEQKNRGSIQFPAGGMGSGQTVINTFKDADLSTVLHESGHLFLTILQSEAARGEPSAAREFDALKEWWMNNSADVAKDASASGRATVTAEDVERAVILGSTGDKAKDIAIDIGMQEQFARGFEAYLMAGEAPSDDLRTAFSSFREWLKSIYRSLASLKANATPEVRAVFDRLFATDAEIAKASQREAEHATLFMSAGDMGLPPEDFEKYRKLAQEAADDAKAKLTAEVMAPIRRQTEKWYQAEKAALVEKLTAEKRAMPIYRAIQEMRFGRTFEGDETPNIKLNRKVIEKHYGENTLALLPGAPKTGKGHRFAVYGTGDGGMHPDVVAEMYGFKTGRELIGALLNTPSLEEAVEAEANALLTQKHGDVLKDGRIEQAAMDAVKSDKKALLIARELGALNASLQANPTLKRSLLYPKISHYREMARRALERMPVNDARATVRYVAASKKAADEAFRALAKGDIRAAADAKRRHLLSHMMYMEARKIDTEVDKLVTKIGKLNRADSKVGKGVNIDYAKAARAVASKFGLANPDAAFDFDMWLEQLLQDDPATHAALAHSIQTYSQNAKPFKNLTVGEFRAVADAVANLLSLGRTARTVEIEGETISRDLVVAELSAVLDQRGIKSNPALKAKLTGSQKMGKAALSMLSALRRVEAWARDMDDGKQGPYTRYLVRPIMDAVGVYRDVKAKRLAEMLEILKPLRKDALGSGAISAPELDYTFENKAELLHAILHTGNESNKEKLLMGRGWSQGLTNQKQKVTPTGKLSVDRAGNPIMDRGTVDTTKWDTFIARMIKEGTITKADYDAVQKLWDLMEDLKRPAQAAHRKMFGFYFQEIEASPVSTPFGVYRGGYVPAIADQDASNDGQIRADQAALEAQQTSFMFPTTGNGFTKSRVQEYRTPLALNLMLLPAHMDKVLRFTHLEPAIRQTAGIISNREMRDAMDAYDQSIISSMLTPWLQRTAQQAVEARATTPAGRAFSGIARELRRRVGLHTMFMNVVNTAQQITGFSTAMVLVKPGRMASALSRYVAGGAPAMRAEAMAQSAFMRERVGNAARETQGRIQEAVAKPTIPGELRALIDKHGYVLQQVTQNIMDVIIWHAAYDQSIAKGASDPDAVFEADSVIRRTIGDFSPENISLFETGNAFTRLFTMFYSYFNGQANLVGGEMRTAMRMAGWNGAPRMFWVYLMGIAAPAIVAELIVQGFRGDLGDDDDDGYADEIVATVLGAQGRYITAMIPVAGQLTMALVNRFNDQVYDDRLSTSPVVSAVERAVGAPASVGDAIFGDGSPKKATQDGLTALGLITGIPMGQLSKMAGYGADVATGKAEPQGVADVAQGLASGRDGTAQ